MCEFRWCKSKAEDVRVDETMDDGCWSVWICRDCATKHDIKSGDDLSNFDFPEMRTP